VADTYNNLVRKIDAVTSAMMSLGTSASPSFYRPIGVAVDGSGHVYVADEGNNLVRKIDAVTGAVTILGTSASPPFKYPFGVAVDGSGNVYVADTDNSLVRKIDAVTGAVTSLGTSAIPSFNNPFGVAVDGSGNVYVGDWGNSLVRKIDAVTGAVTSLGTSASPPFNQPIGVAVDGSGNVYVADTDNNLVRLLVQQQDVSEIRSAFYTVEMQISQTSPNAFSTPFEIISSAYVNISIDYPLCKSSSYALQVRCLNSVAFSQVHPNIDAFYTGLYDNTVAQFGTATQTRTNLFIVLHGSSVKNSIQRSRVGPLPYIYLDKQGQLKTTIIGVFSTPKGTLLFSSYIGQPVSILLGNMSDAGVYSDLYGYHQNDTASLPHLSSYYKNFKDLMKFSSAVQSTIVPGSPRRYVQLQLTSRIDGSYSTVTYDTFTDSNFSIPTLAAPTKYMLAYTYGLCGGVVTKYLVDLSGTMDYSIKCAEGNGLYYQSPNVYYSLPLDCLTIPYSKLLTKCPQVAKNMATLVNTTCKQSIDKVCTIQYTSNPPFLCTGKTYDSLLTVLSLSFSTTMAIIGVITTLSAIVLGCFSGIKEDPEVTQLINKQYNLRMDGIVPVTENSEVFVSNPMRHGL